MAKPNVEECTGSTDSHLKYQGMDIKENFGNVVQENNEIKFSQQQIMMELSKMSEQLANMRRQFSELNDQVANNTDELKQMREARDIENLENPEKNKGQSLDKSNGNSNKAFDNTLDGRNDINNDFPDCNRGAGNFFDISEATGGKSLDYCIFLFSVVKLSAIDRHHYLKSLMSTIYFTGNDYW